VGGIVVVCLGWNAVGRSNVVGMMMVIAVVPSRLPTSYLYVEFMAGLGVDSLFYVLFRESIQTINE
jgi:hypothetical protein